MHMKDKIQRLRDTYKLTIESPFSLLIGDKEHQFQCVVRNYGAVNGMIIDKSWDKLECVSLELLNMEYGFSCFDIEEGEDIDHFREVLNDWGSLGA